MKRFLGSVAEYLGRNLRIAWKSVFFNYKQYVCFFAALFIVQLLYGLMAVSDANNNAIEYQHVINEYDYHMVLRELNVDQESYLSNYGGAVFGGDFVYKIVRVDENVNFLTGRSRFNMYIEFLGNKDVSEARFRQKYVPMLSSLVKDGESFTMSSTPLLRFEDTKTGNLLTFLLITLVLLAVSVFLLTALYNIRVNQYKFTYGVYMTFGADFKQLFGTAFWELFVISLVTMIPSYLLANLIVWLLYSGFGVAFSFVWSAFLWIFVFNLLVVLMSVFMPMRLMAVRQPMSLIITEDNSNLVSSPRCSVNLFGRKFPTHYEFYSMWRFRKYSVQLLTTAIVFCALFICGLYYANIYRTAQEYPRAQFTIDLSSTMYAYDDEMSEELYALDGVREVVAVDNHLQAIDIASHMIMPASNVLPFASPIVFDSDTYPLDKYRVTNNVQYTGTTQEQLKLLEKYTYTGDLSSLYTQENTIIIGDSISNVRQFNFKVGDQICIAVKNGQIGTIDSMVTGDALLRTQIQKFTFEYCTFTIGAILHDIPCGAVPVFLNTEDYERITGKAVSAEKLEIYIDQSMTFEEVASLERQLQNWGRIYGETKIINTHQQNKNAIAYDKHYFELCVSIAILILLISPLVWFFTQTLYYMKRETEFNILQAMGAELSSIRQIYLQGGVVMAGLSLFVSIFLSYIASYSLYYIFNVVIPKFIGENVRYEFYMPWYAILTSIIVSVACGFFSSYLPYRSYAKTRVTLENGGAGEGEGGM